MEELAHIQRILYLLKKSYKIIDYQIKMSIVRGLDYYRGLVFEIDAPVLGAEKQICGGGAYDLIPLFVAFICIMLKKGWKRWLPSESACTKLSESFMACSSTTGLSTRKSTVETGENSSRRERRYTKTKAVAIRIMISTHPYPDGKMLRGRNGSCPIVLTMTLSAGSVPPFPILT